MNADGAKFCGSCGESLSDVTTCSQCGTENKAVAKFCDECGKSLKEVDTQSPSPVASSEKNESQNASQAGNTPQQMVSKSPTRNIPQQTVGVPQKKKMNVLTLLGIAVCVLAVGLYAVPKFLSPQDATDAAGAKETTQTEVSKAETETTKVETAEAEKEETATEKDEVKIVSAPEVEVFETAYSLTQFNTTLVDELRAKAVPITADLFAEPTQYDGVAVYGKGVVVTSDSYTEGTKTMNTFTFDMYHESEYLGALDVVIAKNIPFADLIGGEIAIVHGVLTANEDQVILTGNVITLVDVEDRIEMIHVLNEEYKNRATAEQLKENTTTVDASAYTSVDTYMLRYDFEENHGLQAKITGFIHSMETITKDGVEVVRIKIVDSLHGDGSHFVADVPVGLSNSYFGVGSMVEVYGMLEQYQAIASYDGSLYDSILLNVELMEELSDENKLARLLDYQEIVKNKIDRGAMWFDYESGVESVNANSLHSITMYNTYIMTIVKEDEDVAEMIVRYDDAHIAYLVYSKAQNQGVTLQEGGSVIVFGALRDHISHGSNQILLVDGL